MIVRTRGGGHREYRANNPLAQDYIPTPAQFGTWLASATGEHITVDKAASIPAVLDAIFTISEAIATLPFRVYQGIGADKQPAMSSWQWRLLHDKPNSEQSAFDFWHDVAACVETNGNAYLLKDLTGLGRNLWVIDPAIVTVERDRRTFAKTFVIRSSGTTDRHPTDPALRLTAADVLHVRGPTLKGGDVGVTPLRLAADALGSAIARNKYEGRAYRNDAVPAAIIEDPAPPNRQKARDTAAVWYQTHGDTNNAGRVGVLMGGATLNRLGLSMQDAQFVESHQFSVSEVARMFRIPASILGAGDLAVVEQDTKRFLSFGLGGRLGRVASAVRADPELFGGTDLYPEHYTRDFIRLDAATEAEVRHKDVQSGVLLVDEARAEQGRPPLPNGAGQVPQITPVGGAPNPALNGTGNNGNGNGASSE
jgi:HK97 family phage portal protein